MPPNEIALITGASKGIGAAVACALARDGYDIWLNYRGDHEAAKGVAARIGELGRSCRLLPFDVSDAASVKAALGELLETETPSVLVNNAGFTRDALMVWMQEAEWKDTLSVHLDGFFHVFTSQYRIFIDQMRSAQQFEHFNVLRLINQNGAEIANGFGYFPLCHHKLATK
jgi:3-oxoacyl-[acyl-carrier protein] reductase